MTVRMWCPAIIFMGILQFGPAAQVVGPLSCDLGGYRAQPGLKAAFHACELDLSWRGEQTDRLRMVLTTRAGTPVIRTLVLQHGANRPSVVLADVTPEYEIVTGYRRATDQQLRALRGLGVPITKDLIDQIKWDAFWDAPLEVPGSSSGHSGSTPPPAGVADQPGLPRQPHEVSRAAATYSVERCTVSTDGARMVVTFPGVRAGLFSGRLEYTIYRGSNLIQQAFVATTDARSVAYKYDAGLSGLTVTPASRVIWRSNASGQWVDHALGGAANERRVPVKTANRLIAAQVAGAAIAAFPPPHRFFWAREHEFNLGYNWYRKDAGGSFSFGVRQAEHEERPHSAGHGAEDVSENFTLYSARPGTWQRMPVFFHVSAGGGREAIAGALAYTRGDTYKPLAGYKVMATHFHTGLVVRLDELGGTDGTIPDFDLMKGAGINIFAPIDGPDESGVTVPGTDGPLRPKDHRALTGLARYYEVAERNSDTNFLIMPNYEELTGILGGHTDFILSHPTFYIPARKAGEPFVQDDQAYGKVYRIGDAADAIAMAEREDMLYFMPHPRTKASSGFPDAIRDTAHFRHAAFAGIGVRWGMGLDGSEVRLCELRCLATLDDMNNWVADLPIPPKYGLAITETYYKGPGDDIYANNPVSYLRLARTPTGKDWSPITDALKRGEFFWTSGEVLVSDFRLARVERELIVEASVQWTFPLDFVEVVWGDGERTGREIVSATHLPSNGTHRFRIPIAPQDKKWLRFAAWDTAGNGAFAQPVKVGAR